MDSRSYTINSESVFIPRPRQESTTIQVAGFVLTVLPESGVPRYGWQLHEGSRLVDCGGAPTHSSALGDGTAALLGQLRRCGSYANAARIKRGVSR